MTLAEHVKAVQSREDFTAFVRALHKDLRDNPGSWENADLGPFLEALGAWLEDMDGYFRNHGRPVPQLPDWNFAAEMLMAAKTYE